MRARLALGCLKLAHSELAVVSLLPHAPRAPELFFPCTVYTKSCDQTDTRMLEAEGVANPPPQLALDRERRIEYARSAHQTVTNGID